VGFGGNGEGTTILLAVGKKPIFQIYVLNSKMRQAPASKTRDASFRPFFIAVRGLGLLVPQDFQTN